MFKLFLSYFIGLLAIVDPPSAVPVWITLTRNKSAAARQALSLATVKYMFVILICFLLLGNAILEFFNVSLVGMRIAGGIMLILSAFEFLHGHKEAVNSTGDEQTENIAFTPMAMPLLSGPGSIAVILGIGGNIGYVWSSPDKYLIAICAILAVCAITYLALKYSPYIQKLLGDNLLKSLTLFMGFILLCIGVQFIVDSTTEILHSVFVMKSP